MNVKKTNRAHLAKALVIEGSPSKERAKSNVKPSLEEQSFVQAGAIAPPYDACTLNRLFENSSTLRPNVDAYVQNIDSNGARLEPVVDLDGDDARAIVADAMRLERMDALDRGLAVTSLYPTESEVTERIRQIREMMGLERFRIDAFLDGCTVGESFTSIRRKMRQDLEVTGNGFWEVLRERSGRIAQFVYIPTQTMRLLPVDPTYVKVQVPVRSSPISVRYETLKHRFRAFVQCVNDTGELVYFKEVGDPRTMSSKSGKYYANEMELEKKEKGVAPATEIMHFRVHSPSSAYGVPRWIGSLLSVIGAREAEEVNLTYFNNKSVPPLAVLVSGGRLSKDSAAKIRDFIDTEIKGKSNFHKILVIEAEGSDSTGENTGKMKIEIKPLTSAQQSDALFQKYDERNHDKIGFMFRMPRLLRGDIRDFNRSTAEAALVFAESQVFGPERNEFDFMINRTVLASLGFRYWIFRSNAVQVQNPEKLAEMIGSLTGQNVLVPADSRKLAGELVFNRRLPKIDADWAYQPAMLTQVGVPFDRQRDGTIPSRPTGGEETTPAQGNVTSIKSRRQAKLERASSTYDGGRLTNTRLREKAAEMIELRDELDDAERKEARKAFENAATDEKEAEVTVIRMTLDEARKKLGAEIAA
jgi:PBSX family phage portal protein